MLTHPYGPTTGDTWNIKNGQQAVFSNEKGLRRTIGSDVSAAIKQVQSEIRQLDEDFRRKRREADDLEGLHSERQRDWNKARRAQRSNDDLVSTLSDQIDQMKAEIEATDGYKIDTAEYEEDVAKQSENVTKYAEEKERAKEELEKLKPAVDAIEAKIVDVDRKVDKLNEDMKKAEDEIAKCLETQSQQKDIVARKRDRLEKYEEAVKLHAQNVQKLREEKEKWLLKARKLHFRAQQRKEAERKGSPEGRRSLSSDGGAEPSRKDLESIEPKEVEKGVEHYDTRVKRGKEKIKQEKEKRKLTDEDPTEAYEKYMQARQIVGKFVRNFLIMSCLLWFRSNKFFQSKNWKKLKS